MIQPFLESVLVFQLCTSRYSPIVRKYPGYIDLEQDKRFKKWIMLCICMIALWIFQIFTFVKHRPLNYFEVLDLTPQATSDVIENNYQGLYSQDQNQTDSIVKTAYECLKKSQCRAEYSKFGSGIDLTQAQFDVDWRLGCTVGFYMMYAFVQATLSSQEQKPGLRLSMGLGIMFCISEVQILQDVSAQIMNGNPPDRRIETLLSFFPKNYCAFEMIYCLRVTFFTFFNVINAYSACFVNDPLKERQFYALKIWKTQVSIKNEMTDIANQISSTQGFNQQIDLDKEMSKKEYINLAMGYVKDMEKTIAKSKKSHEPKPWIQTPALKMWIQRIAMLGLGLGLLRFEIGPHLLKEFGFQ